MYTHARLFETTGPMTEIDFVRHENRQSAGDEHVQRETRLGRDRKRRDLHAYLPLKKAGNTCIIDGKQRRSRRYI